LTFSSRPQYFPPPHTIHDAILLPPELHSCLA
jgi:hypothetical protein